MAIRFECSNSSCTKTVKAPDSLAGKKAKCPHCGQVQHVPREQDLIALDGDSDATSARTAIGISPGDTRTPPAGRTGAPAAQPAPAANPKARCVDCGIGYSATSPACPICGRRNTGPALASSPGKPAKATIRVPSPPSAAMDDHILCPDCGAACPPPATTCGRCGRRLPVLVVPAAAQASPPRPAGGNIGPKR